MYRDYPYESAAANVSHAYLCPAIDHGLSALPEGARVLDIGCGNGSLTAAWAKGGWDVTGVDLSEPGITHAKASHANIAFHRMPVGPELVEHFGEGSFDAIVSAEVVEHLYAPRDLTQSAFRLLKDGGVLILTTPYNGYLKNLVLAATGTMDRHWTALWDGGHIKFWSWGTICRLLAEAGFITPEFRGAGRHSFLWKSMVVRAWKPRRTQDRNGRSRDVGRSPKTSADACQPPC
jgi:cyclopropane fatty-acyl-phospholipid synthase-like methyltransferase